MIETENPSDRHSDERGTVRHDQKQYGKHYRDADTCRFEVTFEDQYGNPCGFINTPLHFETDGDLEIIGPSYVAPVGGHIAFWVKSVPTGGESTGKVHITALETGLPEQVMEIALRP